MSMFDVLVKHLEQGDEVEKAAAIALRYGQYDEVHHLKWTIDQMLRTLASEQYKDLIAAYETDGYEWDVGIAP